MGYFGELWFQKIVQWYAKLLTIYNGNDIYIFIYLSCKHETINFNLNQNNANSTLFLSCDLEWGSHRPKWTLSSSVSVANSSGTTVIEMLTKWLTIICALMMSSRLVINVSRLKLSTTALKVNNVYEYWKHERSTTWYFHRLRRLPLRLRHQVHISSRGF